MIYFIYTDEQRSDAEEIIRFLAEEKHLTVHSQDRNVIILSSDGQVNQDCAVILVSNAAVEDQDWQTLVAEIPEDVRIIPVSCALNADEMNPERIPAKIKEINYIYMDGNHLVNIWDSLVTEKEFYAVKNMLLLNKSAWLLSKRSDDFLLTDRKMIKGYLLLFQSKLQTESDSYFREELTGIINYLEFSSKYARKLMVQKIKDYVKRAAAAVVLAVSLVLFLKFRSLTYHMHFANTIVSVGVSEEIAPINAIKLVEGITNPYVNDNARTEYYSLLSEYLNMNWNNTSVGFGYKYALNDARIAAEERYIWSANGDGKIVKWDTYTGGIVEQTKVSLQPFVAMAVSENETLFIAVDCEGYFFKKMGVGSWEKNPDRYDVSFYRETELVCCGETSQAVLLDYSGKILWFDLQTGFDLIWEGQVEKIFCAELTTAGLEAVVSRDGGLYDIYVSMEGTVEETPIPIEWDSVCSMDIRNGVVLLSDSNYQIVTWCRSAPQAGRSAEVVLSRPLYLCFLNDEVIVYNDRNTGTHLYDLTRSLDLGSILKDAAVLSGLSASGDTVMAASQTGVYLTENIEALLPLEKLERDDICAVYSEKTASSDGMLRQVSIDHEYMIRIDRKLEEGNPTLIIDSATRYNIGEAQRDVSLISEEDSEFSYYVNKPVNFVGKPTVVGITHGGNVLLAGGSDGAFFEIIFSDYDSYIRGAQFQIPSHAAIAAIYLTPDHYYLEDVTGTFWQIRTGYDAVTPEGAIAAVKEKLHCAATEGIYEIVSKETLHALEVAIMPGGGMKEWE